MDLKHLEQKITGCKHFTWREALWVKTLGVCVWPTTEQVLENIIKTAQKLDEIRDYLGAPLVVTSFYRPAKYNEMIGGAKRSSHISGLAVDFIAKGIISDNVRLELKPLLEEFNIRMEALNTVHVHIDLNCVPEIPNEKRFFMP